LGDYQNKDVHVPCDSYIDSMELSNGACSDTIFTFNVNFKYYLTSNKYAVWDLTHNQLIDTFSVKSSADLPYKVKFRRQILKKEDVVFYISDFNKPLVTSNMDTINVIPCNLPKPIISVKPANAASCSGDSVRMVVNVKAVGISKWYYQWYKNGNALTGKSDSVLSIRYTLGSDSGYYHAKVGETPQDTLWSDTIKIH
jgi:hypothetical protein